MVKFNGQITFLNDNGTSGAALKWFTDSLTIGSDEECDCCINSSSIASNHCILRLDNDKHAYLTHTGSDQYKTFIEGNQVLSSCILNHDSVFTLGTKSFRFQYPPMSIWYPDNLRVVKSPVVPQKKFQRPPVVSTPKHPTYSVLCHETNSPTISPITVSSTKISTVIPVKRLNVRPFVTPIQNKMIDKNKRKSKLNLSQMKSDELRRHVSFGPNLSPEQFDKELPPIQPLKKGATPMKSLLDFTGSSDDENELPDQVQKSLEKNYSVISGDTSLEKSIDDKTYSSPSESDDINDSFTDKVLAKNRLSTSDSSINFSKRISASKKNSMDLYEYSIENENLIPKNLSKSEKSISENANIANLDDKVVRQSSQFDKRLSTNESMNLESIKQLESEQIDKISKIVTENPENNNGISSNLSAFKKLIRLSRISNTVVPFELLNPVNKTNNKPALKIGKKLKKKSKNKSIKDTIKGRQSICMEGLTDLFNDDEELLNNNLSKSRKSKRVSLIEEETSSGKVSRNSSKSSERKSRVTRASKKLKYDKPDRLSRKSINSNKSNDVLSKEFDDNQMRASNRKSRLSRKSKFVEISSELKDISHGDRSDKVLFSESHSEGELTSADDNLEKVVDNKSGMSRNSLVSRKSKISRSSRKTLQNSSEVESETNDSELNRTGRKSIYRKSLNIRKSEIIDNNQMQSPNGKSRLSRKSKHEQNTSMLKDLSGRESSDKVLFTESYSEGEITFADDNLEVEDKNNISRNSVVSRKSAKSITRGDNSDLLENTKVKLGRKSRLSRKSMFAENSSMLKDLSRRESSDNVMFDESQNEGELTSADDNLEGEVEDKNNISKNSLVSRKSAKSITRGDNSVPKLLQNEKVSLGRKSTISRSSSKISPNSLELESQANVNEFNKIGRKSIIRRSMAPRKMNQSYSEVDELDKSKLKEAINFQQSSSILNRKSRKSTSNDEINKLDDTRKSINDQNLPEREQENIDNTTLSRKSNINRKSKPTSMKKSDVNVSDNFETHNLFDDESTSFIHNSRKSSKSVLFGQKLSKIDQENDSKVKALPRMSDVSHKSDIFRWKESDNIIRVKPTAGIVLYDDSIDNDSNQLNADQSFHSQVSSNNRNSRKSSHSRKSDLSDENLHESLLSQNSRRISNRKLSSLINKTSSEVDDHNQLELENKNNSISSTPAMETKSFSSENKIRKSNSRKISLNEVQFQPQISILNTSDTIQLNKFDNSFNSGKSRNRKSVSSEQFLDYEDNINEISSSITPDLKMIENSEISQLNESSHSRKSIGKMSINKEMLNSLDSEKTENISMLSRKSSIGRNSRKSDKIKQDTARKSGQSQISRKSNNLSATDSEEITADKDKLINRNSLKSAISRNSVTDEKTSILIDAEKNQYEQPMSFRKSIFNRKSSIEVMPKSPIEGSSLTGTSNLNLPNDLTDKVIIENIDFANQSRKSENTENVDAMIKESNTLKKRGQNKRALDKDSQASNQPPSKRLLRHAVEIVNESAAEENKTSRTMSKRKRENSDTNERAKKTVADAHNSIVETPIKTRGRPKKKEIETIVNEAVDIIDSTEINLNPKKSLPSFDKTRDKNMKNNMEKIDKNNIVVVSQENINEKEDLNNNTVVKKSRGRAKKIHENAVVFNDETVDKSVFNTSGNVKKTRGRTKNVIDENIEPHDSVENLEDVLLVQTIQKITRGKAKKIENIENEESKSVNQNEESESVNQNVTRTRGRPKKIEMRTIDSMSLPDANVNESGDMLQVVKKSRGRGLKEASVENSKASNLKFEDSNSVASSTKLTTRGRPKKVLIPEQRNSLVNEVDNIQNTKDIPKRTRGRKKIEIINEDELILENSQNVVDNIENTKEIPKRTRGRKKIEIINEDELNLENSKNLVDNIENTKEIPKRTRGRKKIEIINEDELILENSQNAVDNIENTKEIPKRTRGRKKIEIINEDENSQDTFNFKKPSLRIRKNKNANDYTNSETSSVIDTEQDLKPLTKRGRKSKNEVDSIIPETSATKLVQEGSISRGRRKLPIEITKTSDKENEVDVKKSNSKKRIQSANVEEYNEIEHVVPKKIQRKNILSETNTNTENQVAEPPRMETRTRRGKK